MFVKRWWVVGKMGSLPCFLMRAYWSFELGACSMRQISYNYWCLYIYICIILYTSIYIYILYIIILHTSIYYIAIPRGPSGHLGTLHSPALQHDRCRVVMGSAAMATEKVPRFLWSWRTTMDTWSGHVWTCFPKWMEKVPKCWSDMNFVWDTWIIHGHYLRAGQLGVVFSVNFLGL